MTNFSVMFRRDTEGTDGLLDSGETHLLPIYFWFFTFSHRTVLSLQP